MMSRNLARPPTKASWLRKSSESSIQGHLQLLHGKCPHGLRGRLGFEHARFLGEWVDALLGWSCGLLLQLQVQHACKLEVSVLLDFTAGNTEESVHDAFHLLVLQTVGLCHRRDNLTLCEHSRLHGLGLHCLHRRCHCGEKKATDPLTEICLEVSETQV